MATSSKKTNRPRAKAGPAIRAVSRTTTVKKTVAVPPSFTSSQQLTLISVFTFLCIVFAVMAYVDY